LEPLLPLLQDQNNWVRQAVAGALGKLGDARALEPLLPLLQDQDLVIAYAGRAEAHRMANRFQQAIADATETIRLDPKYAFAYGTRGDAYRMNGESDRAIADASEAIRLDPKYAFAYGVRGGAYNGKGEYDRAIADASEAIRLGYANAFAYFTRAAAYRMKKEYDKALADYNEGICLDPKNASSYNSKAWFLATCPDATYRDGQQAIDLAKVACELSNWKTSWCIGTLGAAYAETGAFDLAAQYQMRALEDPLYESQYGESGRKRLELYKSKMPYRDE
jgi:tetratricopeptide (TPR) repeat protein